MKLATQRDAGGSFVQLLVALVVLLGQLYLAILIARLVGLHLFHEQSGT